MRFKKHLTLALLLILSVAAAPGQSTARQRLEAAIRFLADDLLEGRGTPSRGLDLAALYLANELREAGWLPANGESYFQPYKLRDFSPKKSAYTVSVNGIELKPEEFYFLPFGMDPARTPVEYELMFAGFGVVAPERGVDDLKDADLEGKGIVALAGAPWEVDVSTPMGYDRALGKSIQATVRKGALLLYATHEFEAREGSGEMAFFREMVQVDYAYLPAFEGKTTMGLGPILAVSPAVFDRALSRATGATYSQWQERLRKDPHSARKLNASVRIHIDAKPRESEARNVVAMLAGSDAKLRDEWIVLTAHYDHLGSKETPPGQDGVWNGADDNASGTAGVLELARRLSSMNPPPKRSSLVFLTSGEDRGLLGSAFYSVNPLVPYGRVVVNINVDMVGRSDGSVQAIAPGSTALFESATAAGKTHGIKVLPDQQPSWRILYLVDSYHFARFDVPAIEFFTGLHKDYHQPSDEADLIHYDELSRIMEVITEVTREYAQGAKRPDFKRPDWFLTP